MLEQYGHGGDLLTARQLYGREEFADFSSNMNPLGPPEAVERILRGPADWIVRYPDPAVRELRARLAERHGIAEDCILVGNGAAELIDLAVREIRPRLTALAAPCFAEYGEAAVKAGSGIAAIALAEQGGYRLSAGQVAALAGTAGEGTGEASRAASAGASSVATGEASRGASAGAADGATGRTASEDGAAVPDLWLLGHPNNPTGRRLDAEAVAAARATGRPVILDEAFMDFIEAAEEAGTGRKPESAEKKTAASAPEATARSKEAAEPKEAAGSHEAPPNPAASLIAAAAEDPNLLVLRSMTKFYSIPGIRLGYLVSHPERIARLRALQVPWSVNGLAQAIGCAVLEDEAFARRTGAWLAAERPWLANGLRRLGLTVYPSEVNYLLVRLPDSSGWTASALQAAMGRRGLLVRDASRMGGLTPGHIRLAVKARRDHERLLAALEECLRLGPSPSEPPQAAERRERG
ncbi:pyridoxal phosphate-dependent aminotransferase [Gorillibacterium sp. sgz500922]|uniref:pyridoxal phosphate-dependent aminotransferase n=1 Tax=Gorillibacterium sp. sgz500922 TaxID=3446694 RepID=UPI003F665B47